MKKLYLIFLFLINCLSAEEIKIYRQSATLQMVMAGSAGVLFSMSGIGFLRMALTVEERDSVPKTIANILTCGLFSAASFWYSAYLFNLIRRYKKWNNLLDQPLLILDDDGFTLHIITDQYEAKYIRYSWKDIVNCSVISSKEELYKTWRYTVFNSEGKLETITISENELVIPQGSKAKIETILLTPLFLNPQKN